MAETPFTFRLVTPQRLLLESGWWFAGARSGLGVLAHHAPLIWRFARAASTCGTRRERGATPSGFLGSGGRAAVLAIYRGQDEIDVAGPKRA
jgi:hypothetical protein